MHRDRGSFRDGASALRVVSAAAVAVGGIAVHGFSQERACWPDPGTIPSASLRTCHEGSAAAGPHRVLRLAERLIGASASWMRIFRGSSLRPFSCNGSPLLPAGSRRRICDRPLLTGRGCRDATSRPPTCKAPPCGTRTSPVATSPTPTCAGRISAGLTLESRTLVTIRAGATSLARALIAQYSLTWSTMARPSGRPPSIRDHSATGKWVDSLLRG